MPVRLLLIDAFNLVRRIYEARKGGLTETISASTGSISRALREASPTHACIVFDSHDRTFRHVLYPEYKASRAPTPAELLSGVPLMIEAFERDGIRCLMCPGYEADDVIATLADGVAGSGGRALILSTDRSFLQLLGPNITVINHFEGHEVTSQDVADKFGVDVSQLTDLWAMAGDSSNNIKGVPRIGNKTGAALLLEYGSLEAILNGKDSNAAANRVRESEKLALRCRQLVTLKRDVELGINLKILRLKSR